MSEMKIGQLAKASGVKTDTVRYYETLKLMTVCTTMVGLAPIFVTEGLGSDVMRRIALPMIGGMTTTTILTLIVIPVVYYIWEGRRFSLNQSKNEGESNHENA